MTVSDDFTSLAGPYRGELLAHCYRMLGSADEAEDLVQETYLPAWRGHGQFEGRSSVRTWLYRIAANGQPAFAAYQGGADSVYRAHALQVLTLSPTGITRIVVFLDPEPFRIFRLPPVLG